MKKGFTLVELMGVIVILMTLFLLAIPMVDRIIKQSNQDLYNEQINLIETSLQQWANTYQKPNKNETIKLTLSQLKESGLIDDVTNPKTEELFPNDMVLTIHNNDGTLEYIIEETGTNTYKYEELPELILNGNALVYLELGNVYEDLGTSEESTVVGIEDILIDTPNTYFISYTREENGVSNIIYRSVVVRDTTPPAVTFSNLTLSSSNVSSYDFTTGVTISDLSETLDMEIDTSTLSAEPGVYSIRYTVKDIYGNQTIKYRKVTVN